MSETLLDSGEVVTGRPFTDAEHTTREAEVLRELLARERRHAEAWVGGEKGQTVVLTDTDEHGHRYLLVVPDTKALIEARDVTVVGFFGRPREDVDHGILFELEEELVAAMPSYAEAGLLSYYDVELVKGEYGNLILFTTPEAPGEWATGGTHRQAVDVSPGHYHEIRLHRGRLDGGVLEGGTITLERTRYLDFSGGTTWRAMRPFTVGPGAGG